MWKERCVVYGSVGIYGTGNGTGNPVHLPNLNPYPTSALTNFEFPVLCIPTYPRLQQHCLKSICTCKPQLDLNIPPVVPGANQLYRQELHSQLPHSLPHSQAITTLLNGLGMRLPHDHVFQPTMCSTLGA